jgi:carboxypeptidase C (cathepsin A)
MNPRDSRRSVFVALLLLAGLVVMRPLAGLAADPPDPKKAEPEPPSVTEHETTIGGKAIKYTATAGYMRLPDYEGKPKADVFYIAYTRHDIDPAPPASQRPITFAFNGGPGSSSVWLHLGAIGPKRVDLGETDDPPTAPAPPYKLVENDSSWLDVTDLVFIDPVSTGYSRPVEGENSQQFHGVDEDVRSVGEFIRLYTTRNQRWASPKFLAGESYGTTRAAGLSGYLQDEYGMYLSGIVLVSAVLNFQTIEFDQGNDTPYWLYVPTYAATAWYHHKLAPDLQADLAKAISQAEVWAGTEYLQALAKGDALTPEERGRVAAQLAKFTGLSRDFVERSELRIHISQFTKELLRDQGRTVGRLDSRYKGIDRNGVGSSPEFDPSLAAITGAYTATLNDYLRGELGYKNDKAYEILTGKVHPWNFSSATNRYVNVAETLRRAMSANPNLRVYVACGYYDLATPFFAADYTVSHLGLNESLRGNITLGYYQSGHMIYVRKPDLAKLKADAAALIAGAGRPK